MTITPINPSTLPPLNMTTLYSGQRLPAFFGVAATTGHVFTADCGVDVDDAITEAGLDFTVTTHPVFTQIETGEGVLDVEVAGHWSTVRNNTDGESIPLGIVKGRYSTIQNADGFAFAQHLIDDFGANVVAAGQFGIPLGSNTFLALKIDEVDAAGEVHDVYCLLKNSHDGSTGLTAAITAVRRESMSEAVAAIPGAPQRFTLRHSGNVGEKYHEAIQTVKAVRTWMHQFKNMTDRMLGTRLTREEFTAVAETLLPTPRGVKAGAAQRWGHRRATLIDLFENAPTCSYGRGTVYAGFCAVNEYVDHYAATRGGDPTTVRYARNLNGKSQRFKEVAWRLLAAHTT